MYSSPDTTLLYPGFSGIKNPDPLRKMQPSTRDSSAGTFPSLVIGSVPVAASQGPDGRPTLRRSSLTQAMRGEKSFTATPTSPATGIPAVGGRAPVSAQLLGGNLRSASEPGQPFRGGVCISIQPQPQPANAAVQGPLTAVRRCQTIASLLSRKIAAAAKLPQLSQHISNNVVPYTLTASDAAAIATAQENTHPTIRSTVWSPLPTHTTLQHPVRSDASNGPDTFADKVAALRPQQMAPVKVSCCSFPDENTPRSPPPLSDAICRHVL